MNLEQVKQSAPRVSTFTEVQFIVGTPDNCRLERAYGGSPFQVANINGETVLAVRGFAATDYAHDQQGRWVDSE